MSFGAQIALDYEGDDHSSSSSSSFFNGDEEERQEPPSELPPTPNIENIETAYENVGSRPATLQPGRTRSSRRSPPMLDPVGFWNWENERSTAACFQALGEDKSDPRCCYHGLSLHLLGSSAQVEQAVDISRGLGCGL